MRCATRRAGTMDATDAAGIAKRTPTDGGRPFGGRILMRVIKRFNMVTPKSGLRVCLGSDG